MGVLDLLAYTDQAYHHWVKELQALARQNCGEEDEGDSFSRGYGSEQQEEEVGERHTDSSVSVKWVSQENPYLSASPEGTSLSRLPTTPHLTSTPVSNRGEGVPPPLDPYQVM